MIAEVRPLRVRRAVAGLVLSLFVREAPTAPASRGVESTHKLVFAALTLLFLIQLLPRTDLVPTWGRVGFLIESATFLVFDALALLLCIFWFWIYFADRSTQWVTVHPQLFGRPQQIALTLPNSHTSQFLLLTLPAMVLCFSISALLLLAQLVYILQLATYGEMTPLLSETLGSANCEGFGDASHRAFVAVFAAALGSDHECLRVSTASGLSAALYIGIWIARLLIATIAFGIFLQFGGTIFARRR